MYNKIRSLHLHTDDVEDNKMIANGIERSHGYMWHNPTQNLVGSVAKISDISENVQTKQTLSSTLFNVYEKKCLILYRD